MTLSNIARYSALKQTTVEPSHSSRVDSPENTAALNEIGANALHSKGANALGTSKNALWDEYGTYSNKGNLSVAAALQPTSPMEMDKGTAAWTTVNVSRKAFDSIVSATTGGTIQWEELGVDENKRWVVINGQRFECEHSPEEKAARRRAQMTLMDYLEAIKKFKKEQKDPAKEPGNLDALKANGPVMDLIKQISGSSTDDGAIEWLHKQ